MILCINKQLCIIHLGHQSVCTVSSMAVWALFKVSLSHTHTHIHTLTGLDWPVGHTSLMCDCLLFAHSKHFQVPFGLHLSDQHRLVSVRPLFPGCGIALDFLGFCPADRGHRLFTVHGVVATRPHAPSGPGGEHRPRGYPLPSRAEFRDQGWEEEPLFFSNGSFFPCFDWSLQLQRRMYDLRKACFVWLQSSNFSFPSLSPFSVYSEVSPYVCLSLPLSFCTSVCAVCSLLSYSLIQLETRSWFPCLVTACPGLKGGSQTCQGVDNAYTLTHKRAHTACIHNRCT